MSTKMRAKTANGETEVAVLVDHPMETGRRIDPRTKKKVPAHFIQKMTFRLNGKEFAVADLGSAVSRNPLVKVRIRDTKPGDRIRVTWTDNKGETGGNDIVL